MDRRCVRCGACKPITAFERDRLGRDGRRVTCKACRRASAKRRMLSLSDAQWQHLVERNRTWRQQRDRARMRERVEVLHLITTDLHRRGYRVPQIAAILGFSRSTALRYLYHHETYTSPQIGLVNRAIDRYVALLAHEADAP